MKISLQQHWTTTSLSQALHLGELRVLGAVAGALQLLDHPLQERHVRPHLGELPLVRRRHLFAGRNYLHHFLCDLCHHNLLSLLTAFSRSGPHLYFEAVWTALVFSFMGLVAFPCLAFPVLANWQEQQQQQWYDDTTICVPILKANMPKLMSVSFYICWAKYMLNYIFKN